MSDMLFQDNLFPRGDEFYERLMTAHDGLSHQESEAFNARLILIMANTIGDVEKLKSIIAAAEVYHDE